MATYRHHIWSSKESGIETWYGVLFKVEDKTESILWFGESLSAFGMKQKLITVIRTGKFEWTLPPIERKRAVDSAMCDSCAMKNQCQVCTIPDQVLENESEEYDMAEVSWDQVHAEERARKQLARDSVKIVYGPRGPTKTKGK